MIERNYKEKKTRITLSTEIHTVKPSSRKMTLEDCKIPVYFEDPYESLCSSAHEDVGSN